MGALEITALLLTLAAAFSAVNYWYLRLPNAIGILVVALFVAISVMIVDWIWPSFGLEAYVRNLVEDIEFSSALMEWMLGLLLFAGALHVNIQSLRESRMVIFLMATLGVFMSTAIIGFGTAWIFTMPVMIAMVYGALISPTDPVAVLGILRQANLPKSLETQIAGESLFNDGVAYVLFLILVSLAFPTAHGHHEELSAVSITFLFIQEALGGALLGAVLGWLTFQAMKRIDDFSVEVLMTLALAFGGYSLASALHLSGPICAVVSGLFIGDVGMRHAMSERTRNYVNAFWELIDEILNSVLFLLIGVEVFAINFDFGNPVLYGAIAILLALLGRFVAVSLPVSLLRSRINFAPGTVRIMTWGGLKGGISVALALSLPASEWKALILTMTYIVVVFSIVVQGLSVGRLAKAVAGREPELDLGG